MKYDLDVLIEWLPACITTKKGAPHDNYWLQILKRSHDDIRYIVRYVCDTFTTEEVVGNPLTERVWHKVAAPKLEDALYKMLMYIRDHRNEMV